MTAVRVTIPQSVVHKKVADEVMLLDFERGVYYGLDPVGSRIWELLAEGKTVDEVVDTMSAEYDAGESTLRTDVANLIADLEKNGLVVTETTSRR
jgi:hypothetical protein